MFRSLVHRSSTSFSLCGSGLFAKTALLRNRQLPDAFSFQDDKVVDRDIHGTFDPVQEVSLTLTRQDEFIFKKLPVRGLQISTVSGELGIRPGHEYKIAKLVPGLISVEKSEGNFTSYFTAGGFAQISNDGTVDINTVECIPLDDIEPSYVERELTQANDVVRNAKSEKEKAIGEIYVSVYEALQAALKSGSPSH